MKAGHSIFLATVLGCSAVLLSSLDPVLAARDAGVHIASTNRGGTAALATRPGSRPTAAPLFNVTHADTNMVRLGGAPAVSRGAGAVSGFKRGPSGRISGQDFSHVRGNK